MRDLEYTAYDSNSKIQNQNNTRKKYKLVEEAIENLETASYLQELQLKCKQYKDITIQLIQKQQIINDIQQDTIICDIPNLKLQFKTVLSEWPTTNKTLITTLILSSIIATNEARIQIITDKNHFAKLAQTVYATTTNDIYQIYHLNNWPSWLTWKALIARKDLNYTFLVNDPITYTTNIHSPIVEIEISHKNIRHDILYPTWRNTPIEHNIRRFIRHIQNAQHIAQWQSQAQAQIWDTIHKEVD
jgi:hypothetical protein